MSVETIKNFLQISVDMRSKFPKGPYKYCCPEEIVLKHGRTFHKKAHIDRPMEKKKCFNNAFIYRSNHPHLYYCEGYGLAAGILPTLHAWCVDDTGTIYDPTWTEDEYTPDYYLGCVFDTNWYINYVMGNGRFPSVFEPGGMFNKDVLEGKFKLINH